MKLSVIAVGAVLALALAATGAELMQVELLLESFDGCGCQPLNPPACDACENLDGQGCNVHDGLTNNPHPGCPFPGVPFAHPNFDYNGPASIDDDWANIGLDVDYAGNYQQHNDPGPFPPNQASQSFTVASGKQFTKVESANLAYISPAQPQDTWNGIGWLDIEALRQAYGLPEPAPGTPSYMALDVKRIGDGLPGGTPENPAFDVFALLIWADFKIRPESVDGTHLPAAQLKVPADNQWHSYHIIDYDGFPEAVVMGIGIRLASDDMTFPFTLTQQVTIYLDNLRLVYWAVDPDACEHDPVFDVDDDGDVDHADFGVFQACITGSGDPQNIWPTLSKDCQCMDIIGPGGDPDQALDQMDYSMFEACASGPGVPADICCDDPDDPEACCFGDGSCQDLSACRCTQAGGTPRGAATACATTQCPQP